MTIALRSVYRGIDPLKTEEKHLTYVRQRTYGGHIRVDHVATLAARIGIDLKNQRGSIYELAKEGRLFIALSGDTASIIACPGVKNETIQKVWETVIGNGFLKGETHSQIFNTPPLAPEELEYSQGSEEWLKWRMEGIGASEAACVLNTVSFDKTAYRLWEEKTGRRPPAAANSAMLRGMELEESARHAFIKATGIHIFPKCAMHPEYPWIRASLDGISLDGIIVEIKCPGKAGYNKARRGEVYLSYLIQIQQQLACCPESPFALYWVWDPVKGGVLMKVYRDDAFIADMVKKENLFWEAVQQKKPPPCFDPPRPQPKIETVRPRLMQLPAKRKRDQQTLEDMMAKRADNEPALAGLK